MIVVANSTPLIALSKIGQLKLLKDYFNQIFIPKEVFDEVVTRGGDLFGSKEVREADWIITQEVKNEVAILSLYTQLGKGEAEVIVLARESGAKLLIIDDRDARDIATSMDLRITGTIGILMLAEKDGRLNLKRTLDELLFKGFRLKCSEYKRITKSKR